MRKLITVLLLIVAVSGSGQKRDCPAGYSYFPTIGTSSLLINADTCLPDSVCKAYWLMYRKNMCGEMGSAMTPIGRNIKDSSTGYNHSSDWVNDSIGCVSKDEYFMFIKQRKVYISPCLYYWINKSASCYENGIQISCCGHIHKTIPSK